MSNLITEIDAKTGKSIDREMTEEELQYIASNFLEIIASLKK